jgi:hypothetical protein
MTRAFDASGNIVSISDVKNGLKCNCFCIDCGSVLIAKKGAEKTHHFSHAPEDVNNNLRECYWSPETETHIMAKEIIFEDKMLEVPLGTINPKIIKMKFDEVYLEVRGENRIPDIIGYIEGEAVYVEIAVTHFCDTQKIAELKKLNKNCIEINLSDFYITSDVISKNDLRAALKSSEKKWLSVAPCGDFAIKMHNHNRAEMKEANEEYKAVKNNYQKEIINLKDNIETLNQKYNLASERVAPIVAELSEKQEKLRILNSQLNNLLPIVSLNEEKFNEIKNFDKIKKDFLQENISLESQINKKLLELEKIEEIILNEMHEVQHVKSQAGLTSDILTQIELDLKNKENEINNREIFLLEKSIKIYEEIEKEAQKIAESRFEKLCAEKDQIIKGKEKKIKDLNSEINQIYSKFGSYLKIKR